MVGVPGEELAQFGVVDDPAGAGELAPRVGPVDGPVPADWCWLGGLDRPGCEPGATTRRTASTLAARLWTTPGTIRALATGSLRAAVAALAFGGVASGTSAIGSTDAPEVPGPTGRSTSTPTR